MLVMARSGSVSRGFFALCLSRRSHSTLWSARIPADESIRPGQLGFLHPGIEFPLVELTPACLPLTEGPPTPGRPPTASAERGPRRHRGSLPAAGVPLVGPRLAPRHYQTG